MARYSLKKISNTVHDINLGSRKVGTVTQYGSRYTAVLWYANKRIEKTAHAPGEAFTEVVRSANRIAICGEDDAILAHDTLNQRNEATRQMVEKTNQLFRDFGIGSPFKTRRRKVTI